MHFKTLIAGVVSLPLTFMVDVMKYIFQDWEFAGWICIAVIIDTVASMAKHWVHKDLNSEDFWNKFAKKIFVYIILMITSNLLVNYTVNGNIIGTTQWIGEYLCIMMLIREAISIFENVNGIMPVVPSSILKRLKDFNEKGEYIKKDEKNN